MRVEDDDTIMEAQSRPESVATLVNKTEYVDENIIAKLPPGTTIKSTSGLGTCYWTQATRLDGELADGTSQTYFLKIAFGDEGHAMMNGEFESETALYAIDPTFVPKPIGWGSCTSDPNKHFFLSAFHNLTDELPEVSKFCSKLVKLHVKSMDLSSSNGKFGFHVTTHHGNLPQDNTWCDSWEEFFTRGLRRMLDLEEHAQGPSEELRRLSTLMFEKVIPRLLRPLETGDRKIRPCLVHGDLWYRNAKTNVDTDEPMIFGACAFWAHNEYEMGTWRHFRYRIGRPYIKRYLKLLPVSAPEKDFEDRNALYSIQFGLHDSARYRSSKFRRMILEEMKKLVEKYPDGLEGFQCSP